MRKERGYSLTRAFGCAMLLTLLAISGYVGANREGETVSVAVTRSTLDVSQTRSTPEEIRERLKASREQEIALLDSVIANEHTAQTARQSALNQKADIVMRMENEAQILASLQYMGYEDAGVVCGAQMATVFVPQQAAASESDRMKIIDAATGQTGITVQSVKIIAIKP